MYFTVFFPRHDIAHFSMMGPVQHFAWQNYQSYVKYAELRQQILFLQEAKSETLAIDALRKRVPGFFTHEGWDIQELPSLDQWNTGVPDSSVFYGDTHVTYTLMESRYPYRPESEIKSPTLDYWLKHESFRWKPYTTDLVAA